MMFCCFNATLVVQKSMPDTLTFTDTIPTLPSILNLPLLISITPLDKEPEIQP